MDYIRFDCAGAGAEDLSDIEEEEGDGDGDEAHLAKFAGMSVGASDADTAGGLNPPPTAYTALQVCVGRTTSHDFVLQSIV